MDGSKLKALFNALEYEFDDVLNINIVNNITIQINNKVYKVMSLDEANEDYKKELTNLIKEKGVEDIYYYNEEIIKIAKENFTSENGTFNLEEFVDWYIEEEGFDPFGQEVIFTDNYYIIYITSK